MIRLEKSAVRKIRLGDTYNDGFVEGTPAERLAMVWDITVALWSVSSKGKIHAQSRLQRDVEKLRRGRR